MSDVKRQLGIKTRSVKRLAADVRSYINEKATHESSYARASAADSAVEAHDVRRARDFVDEAEATLRDVRQRLRESAQQLTRFIAELAAQPEHAALMQDDAVAEARAMLAEVAPLVGEAGAAVGAAGAIEVRAFKVAVLGDSSINEDDALWRTSEQLGELLARGGFHVLTGGYSGISEAVSFGASRAAAAAAAAASSAASAPIAGITCPAAFAHTLRAGASGPNQYLSEQRPCDDLLSRAGALVGGADALVVLPGGLGTLAKLTLAWNLAAVEAWNAEGGGGAQQNPARLLLAWREPWEALLTSVGQTLRVPDDLLQCVKFVSSVEEALQHIEQAKASAPAASAAAAGASSSSAV